MTDAFAQSTLHAATLRIQGAVSATADRLTETLALGTPPPGSSRQALTALQLELRRKLPGFNLEFANALREKIQAETLPRSDSGRGGLSTTSWESLTLVDDAEVDERVSAERLSMEIAHECEWELRELDGYVGAILSGKPDPERNPLRTEGVATALVRAIKLVSPEAEDRKLLVREFGRALAPAMRSCYAEIVAELRAKGVRAATLAVRTTQGPGNDLPREVLRENSGYQTSGFRSSGFGTGHGAGPGSGNTPLGGPTSGSTPFPGSTPGSAPGSYSQAVGGADVQMLEMLRRIANLIPDTGFAPTEVQVGGPAPSGPAALGAGGGGLRSAAPVNLIRQHREELVRASGGALDHMVIDVVSAMFDHLLNDAKVPPQLARQIARLQMPVLRAALKDMDFFSSRRHPVRRFVNRIASLAVAYEDLDQGPGRDFIERVRALVQDIVEGDFDQMDLYESKLQAIESLIHEQSARDVGTHATAAALLDGKETQLRIQQRFTLQLRAGLEPLALPDYLRDFLSQVWSQVQVQVAGPGHDPELVQRMSRTVRELVLSIQPKGEPALRKAFLLTLPQLMKDLNEGLALIRWPEAAKKEFFAKLLPAHAGSLKAPPPTDFEQRQLKFKLEQLGKIAIPTAQDLGPSSAPAPLPKGDEHAAPLQFSDEEAQRIGLVEESAVDWDGVVDIDLDEPAAPSSDTDPGAIAGESAEVDIAVEPAPDAPPTHGPQLIHYLQPGIAYRMHLEGRWQRVRLNWVSPGRAFFVFTHGKAHEKTLSMTARMLTRLCETERIRTFEQAELIERATARARKQLAQLTAASRHGALGARS